MEVVSDLVVEDVCHGRGPDFAEGAINFWSQ